MQLVAKSNNISLSKFVTLAVVISLLLALGVSSAYAAKRQPIDNQLRKVLLEAANSSDSFTDRFEAEVWLSDMSNRMARYMPEPEDRIQFLKNVHYEAKRADLAPELVLSVIHVESAFNRWAISSVGAQGFMQVMPFWLKEIGRDGDSLFDMQTNLRFGCTILRHYLDREKGNLTRALARYNGSLGRFKYPNKVFDKLQNRWFRR